MRVLVCGGRDFTDYRRLSAALYTYCYAFNVDTFIVGGAMGADTLAESYARDRGYDVEVYPAQWSKYGKSAGYIRNKQMLEEGKPDLVIAFPGGKGTAMMVDLAMKAGVDTLVIGK